MPLRLTVVLITALVWQTFSSAAAETRVAPPAGLAWSPDSAAVPANVLRQRRAALLEMLDPGIALVRSADRLGGGEHPQASDFRQDNEFYYLTGVETPGSWLVLVKSGQGAGKATLYVPQFSPREQMVTGRQPSLEELKLLAGVESVRPISEFEGEVLSRLRMPGMDYPKVYMPLGDGERMREAVEIVLQGRRPVEDLEGMLSKLRHVKDSVEIDRLRRAIEITAEAQREALAAVRPGMYEYELEAVVEYVFRSRGAERVGFPTIVGSGPNSVVLHHDTNRRRMEESELVVIDAGAEFGYYTADITRTLPVSGRFTPRQRQIYELVLATQRAAIDSVRPGMTVWQLEAIARRYMQEHSNGICGDVTCDRYFVHGLSHWLGMNVHDVGSYGAELQPGMVLTIEPGVYIAEEDLGVRIEDDVLVTESGHEVLSSGAPKSVDEIERLMGADSLWRQR